MVCVACGQPWPIRTYPCLISESISHRWEIERRECDNTMRYATPFSSSFYAPVQARLEAVTVPGPKGSRNETPFRPLAEALDPYRAENRCALNSLDTDRSTTLSPGTVTANVYLQHPYRISQPVR